MPFHKADDDPELSAWVAHFAQDNNEFLRAIAETAKLADYPDFQIMRPVLQKLRVAHPEPNHSFVVLTTRDYQVKYEDVDSPELEMYYNDLNFSAFDNGLPYDVKLRWALSIQSLRSPIHPIGMVAHPNDPQADVVMPGQWRITQTHIFITDRLKNVSPADQVVLLHEMCHLTVPNHEKEFVDELKRALEAAKWSPMLGGEY